VTRKDFYREYYRKTNRARIRIWHEDIWFGGRNKYKFKEVQDTPARKYAIVMQYVLLALCWIPLCLDYKYWMLVPLLLSLAGMHAIRAKFSFILIEVLYAVYRRDNVYCAMLHSIFLNSSGDYLETLTRSTKKVMIGYIHEYFGGGWLSPKFEGICRNRENKVFLIFRKNKVVVKVNDQMTVINKVFDSQEQLLCEIARVINSSL